MSTQDDGIKRLQARLELLFAQQERFAMQINDLKIELGRYQKKGNEIEDGSPPTTHLHEPSLPEGIAVPPVNSVPVLPATQSILAEKQGVFHQRPNTYVKPQLRKRDFSNLEKFIGENLISKIGIAILIIGLAIGTKYSIDHELISPLARIILGYVAGTALLITGIKLKVKYEQFSAVLVSGAITVFYFLTYAAYDFYGLIPQLASFILMFIFTAFAVFTSLQYNKQLIAVIGLAGAYAVPFLLSDGSGRVIVLLLYMTVINAGILYLAFKKNWEKLFYTAFALSWLILTIWIVDDYNAQTQVWLALGFLTIHFIGFYTMFLANIVIKKEVLAVSNGSVLFINALIYFALEYAALYADDQYRDYLGLYCIWNALLHFIFTLYIYRKFTTENTIFYLVAGLVLSCITIAVPVQLEGNWVTLFWLSEAMLIFYAGRKKSVAVYEYASYALMVLALGSVIQDCSYYYNNSYSIEPIVFPFLLNIHFATVLLCAASFIIITYIDRRLPSQSPAILKSGIHKILSIAFPIISVLSIYAAFSQEIAHFFNMVYADSAVKVTPKGQSAILEISDEYLPQYKQVWHTIYTLFFVTLLYFANKFFFKNKVLNTAIFIAFCVAIAGFLLSGLPALSFISAKHTTTTWAAYFEPAAGEIYLRYSAFTLVGIALWLAGKTILKSMITEKVKLAFEIFTHFVMLVLLSNELIKWQGNANADEPFSLGISILWGCYAVMLIGLGIWKKKKHLRFTAIILFAITLLKLFLYDLENLSTIAKTIVFVCLGLLLLLISFLYNKFKHVITNDIEK